MPNLADMRRQHDDAEQIASAIMARVADYRDEYDAIPIVRMVHKLNALLRVHFAYEDMALYPAMMNGEDAEAAVLARSFHEEMGSIAADFEDFARRWSVCAAISAHFEEFRAETTRLFAALGARIERENDRLFPLAQRMLAPRAGAGARGRRRAA